jgi:hypothetical protein
LSTTTDINLSTTDINLSINLSNEILSRRGHVE